MNEFHKYMSRTLNLEGATYKKYMEASKRIIRQARKENYLNPSDGLKITLFLYHTEDNTHSKAMIKLKIVVSQGDISVRVFEHSSNNNCIIVLVLNST